MLTFNIVYVPGSVTYLLNYVLTLLCHTSYKFCLVSNACSDDENRMLDELCQKHSERLSFTIMPTTDVWPHGAVLNYLQAREQEPYFCFMDSDIFATGPVADVLPEMIAGEISALFSSVPIWVKESETTLQYGFDEMIGTFNKTWNGICIGGTYYAVYNNAHLKDVIDNTGIGFDHYYLEDIPADVQQILETTDLKLKLYDTGKLINILLSYRQHKLQNIKQPQLCHIGGVSFEINYRKTDKALKKLFSRTYILDKWLWPVRQLKQKNILRKRYKNFDEYQINVNQRIKYRNRIRKYFLELHTALHDHEEIPHRPVISDPEIRQNLELASHQYIHTFKSFYV